ncbi:MAG TPA: DUF6644 family protein [Povalibacter sp.]
MSVSQWAAALEASGLGEWMRASPLAYPVVNVIHLLGLTLLVGCILLLDLRLLGTGRQFPLRPVSTLLTRFAIAGLIIQLVSGFLLFSADAGPLITNPILQAKLAFIAFAVGNALLFRRLWQQRLDEWDHRPPLLGRAQAAASIVAWLTVGTLGRWIAYT